MLKSAMYFNFFMLSIMSIFFITRIFKNNSDLNKFIKLIIIYMIFNCINFYLYNLNIVDTGWDFLFLYPIFIISSIIYIVDLICISIKIKNNNNINYNILNTKKFTILIIIPIIIFIIPYIYELYVINNCSYLLKYNYQNGLVQSDDTYIAIINNKPTNITLIKNLFNRKEISSKELGYNIIYTNNNNIKILTYDLDDNEVEVKNEEIKTIALDAKEKCPSAKGATVAYFPEENYAIIELTSEETSGTILREYFYHNNTYIKNIHTNGSLESVIYYK